MDACEEYRDRLSAYLDGALTGEDRRELLAHLDLCEGCRGYLADQTAIRAALAELEAPAPEGFTARVMERVRAEGSPEKKVLAFPAWRRWAALAACCAVVCLGIFGSGLWRSRSATEMAADRPAAAGAGAETRMMEPEEAPAGEPASPEETAGVAPACAPAVQRDGAAPEYDNSLQSAPAQEPAAEKRTAELAAEKRTAELAEGRTLTAEGPAAQAWAEETLGVVWEAGAVYELTEEQYLELTALLAEAGETFTESVQEGGWRLLAGPPGA